jgi:hypothetical protein
VLARELGLRLALRAGFSLCVLCALCEKEAEGSLSLRFSPVLSALFGFHWQAEDTDGACSEMWHQPWPETQDEQLLQKIVGYNLDYVIWFMWEGYREGSVIEKFSNTTILNDGQRLEL